MCIIAPDGAFAQFLHGDSKKLVYRVLDFPFILATMKLDYID
jgi:hypothetical protein